MDQTSVYSKTSKGVAEFASHSLGLSREHYRLLGMVDGASDLSRLAAKSGLEAGAVLRLCVSLAANGLVHLVSDGAKDDLGFYPGGAEISVTELDAEEGVRAWAEAQRGADALRSSGYFASAVKPMRSGDKPNILSVEDDPLVARLLGVLLTREGFGVTHAADGRSAFRELEENPPDLVLLDVLLPDTTGFDILEWIRKHPALAGLPAIMLTAQVAEEDVQRGLRIGADGYIFKPFRPEPLLECIRKVLKL